MKTKSTPVTAASCAKYKARRWTCECPDRANRGGSHFNPKTHEKVCKHMLALQLGEVDSNEVRAIEEGITLDQKRDNIQVGLNRISNKDIIPANASEAAELEALAASLEKDLAPEIPVESLALKQEPVKKSVWDVNYLKSVRNDVGRRFDEVQFELSLCDATDANETCDYALISRYHVELDDLWAQMEDLDRQIETAIQAEDMTAVPSLPEVNARLIGSNLKPITPKQYKELAAFESTWSKAQTSALEKISEMERDADIPFTEDEKHQLLMSMIRQQFQQTPTRTCANHSGLKEALGVYDFIEEVASNALAVAEALPKAKRVQRSASDQLLLAIRPQLTGAPVRRCFG